jgi:hypothetical protein
MARHSRRAASLHCSRAVTVGEITAALVTIENWKWKMHQRIAGVKLTTSSFREVMFAPFRFRSQQ